MEWTDQGIVLSTRLHGETSVVLELLTRDHGRHLGLVRGGRSRRIRPLLQTGNLLQAQWRARLDDQLGNFTVEAIDLPAGRLMASRAGLLGLSHLATLVRLLPERDAHAGVFDAAAVVIEHLDAGNIAAAVMIRFELELLSELGFGLDLTSCAATGTAEDLVWVSPKSGRAVSRKAGAPYCDRLLALPPFLIGSGANARPTAEDIIAGFRLTGHFLGRYVFEARGMDMPDARAGFIAAALPEKVGE
ncbi:DNA repair protein RecO [Agaricicola taiwanensis]|uniref:DNA repair protein RecO n=1 Tax=Agaricicola taiwanensis TaxID=591372 RepID=A0A8J2YJ85_9RHOB|nr:DNA repair protein RecO [Agaricicola taiwanensis]GGE46493.1 DNA repair protein RecO [Agaricicola taiwanensis]